MATRLKDRSVSTKVIGAFSIVLVATIASGVFSVQRLSQVNADAQEVSDLWLPGLADRAQLEYAAARLRFFEGATLLMAKPEDIESNRAVDASTGFVEVAGEMRALAQSSSDAAKEIKTLINASGEQVGAGDKLVGRSGGPLKQIVHQVEQINGLVTEMALATTPQSTSSDEVNAAAAQMDQVTQQNAAMVEESTAAARNLAGETQTLENLVKFFNVGEVDRYLAQQEATTRSTPAKPLMRPAKARQPVLARQAAVAVAVARKPELDAEDWTEF